MSQRSTEDTEGHVKDALPGEWVAGDDDEDALKAGASIIRQDFWFKHRHPMSDWGLSWCPGVTPYAFDLTTGYIQGYMVHHDPPCVPGPIRCWQTDAATDATKAMGWDAWDSDGVRPDDLELPFTFETCVQDETQYLADILGYEWRQIVGSPVYPPGVYAGDPTICPPDYARDPYYNRVDPPLIANCLYNPFTGDSDCDGFSDSRETFLGTDYQGRCGEGPSSGPSSKWPLDLVDSGGSTDRGNLQDLASFVAPIRRYNTGLGDPNYHVRWDLVAGPTQRINLLDLSAAVGGTTGLPLMFGGQIRAFLGPVCSNHPDYGD